MNSAAGASEAKNPKTGMTHAEMKEFIRNHFEEFVNRKNLRIGEVNFAPEFVDHGRTCRGTASRTCGGDTVRGRGAEKSSRPSGDHRRHDRRGRQSGGAQPLDGHRRGIKPAAGILRNCDLEDRQPADRGPLGLPREPSSRTPVDLELEGKSS